MMLLKQVFLGNDILRYLKINFYLSVHMLERNFYNILSNFSTLPVFFSKQYLKINVNMFIEYTCFEQNFSILQRSLDHFCSELKFDKKKLPNRLFR